MSRKRTEPMRGWTEAEENIVIEQYPKLRPAEVAAILGRSVSAVKTRAQRLGVKSPVEFCMQNTTAYRAQTRKQEACTKPALDSITRLAVCGRWA